MVVGLAVMSELPTLPKLGSSSFWSPSAMLFTNKFELLVHIKVIASFWMGWSNLLRVMVFSAGVGLGLLAMVVALLVVVGASFAVVSRPPYWAMAGFAKPMAAVRSRVSARNMPAIYKNLVGRLLNRNNFHRFVVVYVNKYNNICCNE